MRKPVIVLPHLLVAGLALLLAACQQEPSLVRLSGATMGTTWHVSVARPVPEAEVSVLRNTIESELARINRLMSTWEPESELSRFNRARPGVAFPLSPETVEVLQLAHRVSEASEGGFDVTVGPLVNLWGFGPDMRPDEVPSEAQLADTFARVGYRKLRIGPDHAVREADLYVDLSAVAKGYAVDRVADRLLARGFTDFLVEVGGELRAAGRKQDGSAWRIGIEVPDLAGRSAQRVVRLSDIGVATSGDYRNYFEADGRRYSHTIDPQTGRPITHRLASVTVLDPSAARADAWATALMVLGPEKGLRIANEQELAAFFIIRADDGFTERHTAPFARYLEPTK